MKATNKRLSTRGLFDAWWKRDGKDFGANVIANDSVRKDLAKYAFAEGLKVAAMPDVVSLLIECRSALDESSGAYAYEELFSRIDAALSRLPQAKEGDL